MNERNVVFKFSHIFARRLNMATKSWKEVEHITNELVSL